MLKIAEKIKIFIALNCLSLLAVSCDFLKTTDFQIKCDLSESNKQKQTTSPSNPSTDITPEIKIDATPSMRGFVETPRQSRYAQTLDLLDIVASASWSKENPEIKYYRFGTKLEPIDKASYIEAKTPQFYQGSGDFKDSQIKSAISAPNPNKLSIIVTDLYQADTDIGSVNKALKQYIQQGQAIGILGIKSEFKGWIYDIGVRKDKRYYDTAAFSSTKKFSTFLYYLSWQLR